MQHSDFVHLHTHTQFSLLDGTNRFADLFEKAREYKMPALAITDHGNMFGAVEFYQTACKYGIKPLIGSEVYVAPGNMKDRAPGQQEHGRHLILLAKNQIGYKNLIHLSSMAFLEGFYYRPRIDKALLARHSEGLIALSACLQGEIPYLILQGKTDQARLAAKEYEEIFGKGNYYLEIMSNGITEQNQVNEELIRMGRELSLPLVATNDCHYLSRSDAEAHELLLCIQTGKTMEDANRLRFATDQFYFRSPEEMKALFRNVPEAIENTIKIANECNLELELGKIYLPRYEPPQGASLADYLEKIAQDGLEARLKRASYIKDARQTDAYCQRLRQELDIISSMGFAGYFLIVWDFVNFARLRGIPVGPGRGSAAGSLVAYSLGITNIDPIRYSLFFERFLNPDRISIPDIDIDFCQAGRDEVIGYVMNKYGSDKVAQIITFGKMQAKAVVRDVGRSLGISYAEVDAIAKLIPNTLNVKLEEAIRTEPRLKAAQDKDPKVKRLLELSISLEGLLRHSSTHAAGVVISDIPLVERIPLCRSPKSDVVTQYSMKDLQEVGLAKFDFLGLKTLTVIKDACDYIKEKLGAAIDINNIPLDDPKVFALLHRADTDGVFQLESHGMKEIMAKMKPDSIDDIIALISIYRPGPMKMIPEFVARKHGKTQIIYEVPELKSIIAETYGVILYQEQVMQIASLIGGYSLSEADNLRKVMSKKKIAEMEREKPKFLEGARKKSIPMEKALRIWEQMETFAEYGFNKSHGTAYAFISYQTAYLKANHPVEFMAALLSSEIDNRDNIIKYINTAKDMGITILPPDINESFRKFSISSDNLRFGLAAVKNVGEAAIESILATRKEGGAFKSFMDFCDRIDMRRVNKRVLESLIKCGAFDSIGKNRSQLITSYVNVVEQHQKRPKSNGNQGSFLEELDIVKADAVSLPVEQGSHDSLDLGQLLAFEKETLGFYITSHPLEALGDRIIFFADTDIASIKNKADREDVAFVGMVSHFREITTKKKDKMAYVTFEDMKGTIDAIVFPDVYQTIYSLIRTEEPVVVKGAVEHSDEGIKVRVQNVTLLSEAPPRSFSAIHFYLELADRVDDGILESLKNLHRKYSGSCDAYLHLVCPEADTVVYLGKEARFTVSLEMKGAAERTLGLGSIKIA